MPALRSALSAFFAIVLLPGLLFAATTPAAAAKRVALVIGNAAYVHIPRLANPANDAHLIAATLSGLGFTVIGNGAQLDLDDAGLRRAVQEFGRAIQEAEVAVFYYAGHGVQVRGHNYLVPVGANPTREADVDFQMFDANLVLRQMDGSGARLKLVILDACRNNPFGGRGLRTAAPGLAQMQAPEGTLISFATQPGNVALDGAGRNSPFARALADTMRRPGLDIFRMFNEVGLAVSGATGGQQQPWLSLSPIKGDFYFAGRPSAPQPKEAAEKAPAPQSPAAQAWAAIKDTTSIAMLETFVRQYGDSIYGAFARARLDELRRGKVAVAAPSQAPAAAAKTAPKAAARSLTRADAARLFGLFDTALERARKDHVQPVDEGKMLRGAIAGMRKAFPPAQQVAAAAPAANPTAAGADRDALFAAALAILNGFADAGNDARVVQAAIGGALAALDPHSSYIDAKTFADMQVRNRGEFGGLGIEVTLVDGLIKVVAPIDDTPAAKGGVLAGDLVTHLDGSPVQGLTLAQAVGKMRGPVGSAIRLTVTRKGAERPFEISITRAIVRVHSVRTRIEAGDVGYVRITQFNEQTTKALEQALKDIAGKLGRSLKGYVVDLRNNPGGLLDQAVSVSDLFLERGEIVATRGRTAAGVQRFVARAGDLARGKRIVVMINGGSAAASEIVAGALQDHRRAQIVGSRSFGKGSVQTIIPLGADKGALRLTTALYHTPSGRSIQALGIAPDIEVLQDEPADVKAQSRATGEAALPGHLPGAGKEQLGSQSYIPPDPKDDKALQRAVALLRGSRR